MDTFLMKETNTQPLGIGAEGSVLINGILKRHLWFGCDFGRGAVGEGRAVAPLHCITLAGMLHPTRERLCGTMPIFLGGCLARRASACFWICSLAAGAKGGLADRPHPFPFPIILACSERPNFTI